MDTTRMAAGALGPRLAGRLTSELILRSPQFLNCVKEYEIDLRGNKLTAIENLGATQDQFDSIDLTDNAIIMLEGFPKLTRLKTLILSNNRVTRITRGLEEAIPNLTSLVLINNKIKNLQDVDPLATLPKLQHLSLQQNEVALQLNYRLYVIHRCKRLKVLDFQKVKLKERQAAEAKFGADAPAIEGAKSFEPGEGMAEVEPAATRTEPEPAPEPIRKGPTPEQLTAIKAAIANAATLEEVARLEDALRTGHMPSHLAANGTSGDGPAAMDEG